MYCNTSSITSFTPKFQKVISSLLRSTTSLLSFMDGYGRRPLYISTMEVVPALHWSQCCEANGSPTQKTQFILWDVQVYMKSFVHGNDLEGTEMPLNYIQEHVIHLSRSKEVHNLATTCYLCWYISKNNSSLNCITILNPQISLMGIAYNDVSSVFDLQQDRDVSKFKNLGFITAGSWLYYHKLLTKMNRYQQAWEKPTKSESLNTYVSS